MSRNRTARHALRSAPAAPVGHAADEAVLDAGTHVRAGGREINDPWD